MTEEPLISQPEVKKLLSEAIQKLREEYAHKSFSQRHPELGKMVNCRVCSRRHRTGEPCHKFFALSKRNQNIINGTRALIDCEWCNQRHRGHEFCPRELAMIPVEERESMIAAETKKGTLSAAMFAKKRFRPHHSSRLLQIVELTRELFPKYAVQIDDEQKAMEAARGEAKKVLFRQIRASRKTHQQKLSRKINRRE